MRTRLKKLVEFNLRRQRIILEAANRDTLGMPAVANPFRNMAVSAMLAI
jgi:hypothetical protein